MSRQVTEGRSSRNMALARRSRGLLGAGINKVRPACPLRPVAKTPVNSDGTDSQGRTCARPPGRAVDQPRRRGAPMIDQQEITTAPTGSWPTMDFTEAAALLGVSPWLVLQQIAKGHQPPAQAVRGSHHHPEGGLPDLARGRRRARAVRLPVRGQAHFQRRARESAAEASRGDNTVGAGARGGDAGAGPGGVRGAGGAGAAGSLAGRLISLGRVADGDPRRTPRPTLSLAMRFSRGDSARQARHRAGHRQLRR